MNFRKVFSPGAFQGILYLLPPIFPQKLHCLPHSQMYTQVGTQLGYQNTHLSIKTLGEVLYLTSFEGDVIKYIKRKHRFRYVESYRNVGLRRVVDTQGLILLFLLARVILRHWVEELSFAYSNIAALVVCLA